MQDDFKKCTTCGTEVHSNFLENGLCVACRNFAKCKECGLEVKRYFLNTNGLCNKCNVVKCKKCRLEFKSFYIHSNGMCDQCHKEKTNMENNLAKCAHCGVEVKKDYLDSDGLCVNCRHRSSNVEKYREGIDVPDNNLGEIMGVIVVGVGLIFLILFTAYQYNTAAISVLNFISALVALIIFIIFLSVLYLIKFSSRTKRNIFYLIFFLTYFSLVINALKDRSDWQWIARVWPRTLVIDAPAAALINLLILAGLWWLIGRFWGDYKKDKEEKENK